MFSKEELWNVRSGWIYPNGTILNVPSEEHDNNLPSFCKTIENAENLCVKISCCWGYDTEISEIYLPKKLTIYQAQKLIEINESLKNVQNINIERKINI